MPEFVKISSLESEQKLMAAIEDFFKSGRYAQVTRAVGMHSILVQPERMRADQNLLYRTVLDMVKDKMASILGKKYPAWYSDFPNLMDRLITGGRIADRATAAILSSRHAAQGPFKSVDEFFFWALEGRLITLEQIVQYIEKTGEGS